MVWRGGSLSLRMTLWWRGCSDAGVGAHAAVAVRAGGLRVVVARVSTRSVPRSINPVAQPGRRPGRWPGEPTRRTLAGGRNTRTPSFVLIAAYVAVA